MTNRPTPLRLVALTCLSMAFLAGTTCEDETARKRGETQEKIIAASHELTLAGATPIATADPESFEAKRVRFERVLAGLGRIDANAVDGQQAAAGLLRAAAHRELAAMAGAQAHRLESTLRNERSVASSSASEAIALATFIRVRQDAGQTSERRSLSDHRSIAERLLREQSERLAELDGPIMELEADNKSDQQQALVLQQESSRLRREAAEWGHTAGLDQFRRSVEIRREADGHELKVAQRETKLDYELRPEHDLASRHVSHYQEILAQISDAESALSEVEDTRIADAESMSEVIAGFRVKVEIALDNLDGGEELAALYTTATEHLEMAATDANRSAQKSKGDSGPARLALARTQQQLGELNLQRARGLSGGVALLDRAIDAGGILGDPRELNARRASLVENYESSIASATEALRATRTALDQVKSRDSARDVAEFRSRVDAALTQLTGEAATEPSDSMPRAPRASGEETTAPERSANAKPVASPEAGVAMLEGLTMSDPAGLVRFIDASTPKTETDRMFLEHVRVLMTRTQQFATSLDAEFGADALVEFQAAQAGGMDFMAFEGPRLTDQSEDSAEIVYTEVTGAEETIRMTKDAEGWWFHIDSASTQGPAAAEQMGMMFGAMGDAYDQIRAQVESGEFGSIEEAATAFQASMMKIMGSLMQQ